MPATHASLVQAEILPEAADRLVHERACAAHPGGMHLAFLAIDCLEPGILTRAQVEWSLRAVRKIVLAARTRPTASRKTRRRLVNVPDLVQREATGRSSWRQIVDQAIDAQTLLVLHEALRGLSALDILDAAELGQFDILLRRIAERLVSEQRKAHMHHAPVIEREHVRLPDDDEAIAARRRPTTGSPPEQERVAITNEQRARLRLATSPWVRKLADLEPFPVTRTEAARRVRCSPQWLHHELRKEGLTSENAFRAG